MAEHDHADVTFLPDDGWYVRAWDAVCRFARVAELERRLVDTLHVVVSVDDQASEPLREAVAAALRTMAGLEETDD